jgi:hypothetical protein
MAQIIVSRHRPYTYSHPPRDFPYDDATMQKRTDGVYAPIDGIYAPTGSAYTSWFGPITLDITIDLGTPSPVIRFRWWWHAVWPPTGGCSIATSLDGSTYTTVVPAAPAPVYLRHPQKLQFDVQLPAPVQARYVRWRIVHTQGYGIFIDELDVLSPPPYGIVSRGCPYTYSTPPDPSYPDSGFAERTDGILAATNNIADPAYSGWYLPGPGSRTVRCIIDLKQTYQDLAVVRFRGMPASNYMPPQVDIYGSTDGTTFTWWASSTGADFDWVEDSSPSYRWDIALPQPNAARWIAVDSQMRADQEWIFLDEIEVEGPLLPPATSSGLRMQRLGMGMQSSRRVRRGRPSVAGIG